MLVKEIEKVVRSAIREEMARFFHEMAPYVDEEEMKLLRKEIGSPKEYHDKDFEVVEY